jgi:hypothetical protein
MSYNGYTNYETWCVALWIDNDEHDYDGVTALALAYRNRHDLAGEIRGYVEDGMLPELDAGLAGDLLTSSLCQVNWPEIADGHLDATRQEYNDNAEPEDREEYR